MSTELALHESKSPVLQLLSTMAANGVTVENLAVIKELRELHDSMEDRAAEKAFASAFVELQKETPTILASKTVQNRDGSERYKFAPYEEIMRKAQPLLSKHGFSISFDATRDEKTVTVKCRLTHSQGYSRENSFQCRLSGPPGSTDTQADGSSYTYAKRFALCAALNITIETDDDAGALGSFITQEQADSLRARLKATNGNEERFLRFARAKKFEEITTSRLGLLDKEITRLERNQLAAK